MVPLVIFQWYHWENPEQSHCLHYCMCSRFYQWYQWYTNIVQGSANGTIGNTIGTNCNASGTIGSPNGTIGTTGKQMVPLGEPQTEPLASNDITNGTIGRTLNDIGLSLRVFKVLPTVPISFNVLPMVPLVRSLVPLVSQWYHW